MTAIFFAYVPATFLGAYDVRLRTEHWQTLICCVLLMWTIQFAIAGLGTPLTRNGFHAVLPNLPISGQHAFRWARHRFFVEKWFSHFCICFLCAFAFHDFSFHSPWSIAAFTLLLQAMVIASVQVLQHPWLERFRVQRIANISLLLLIAWMLFLLFANKRIFRIGETPEWLADAILLLTWLFPPSWVLPGRFESGGALLALAWISIGIHLWKKWPANASPYLDKPRDFPGSFGDFSEDEDMDDEENLTGSGYPDEAWEENGGQTGILPAPASVFTEGWVERWVLRWIPEKDRPAAGIFCDIAPSWTFRANWTLRILPLWLLASWLFFRFFPHSESRETITIWIWIISIVLPLIGLMPFSNTVTTSAFPWSSNGQTFPFFAALPVSVRSLLRISMRVTIARCILMVMIGAPYACLLMIVLIPEATVLEALLIGPWMVSAVCIAWTTARPILVYYRLQAGNRRKNGSWEYVTHGLLVILNIALSIVALLAAVIGVVSGLGYIGTTPDGHEVWSLPMGAAGGLLLSAICSRAVFEIYHWRLKGRHLDWITTQ